jgi:cell pole-organizing protein PopZ
MMASAPGQNATVEEILASIRQAISDDDAKRTNERIKSDPKSLADKRPTASVTNIFVEKKSEPEAAAPAPADTEAAELAAAEALADQEFIEQAIEQALDGVRAELESSRPALKPVRPQVEARPVEARAVESRSVEVPAAVAGGGQRAVPRARAASGKRETSPRKALMSPKADATIAASFGDLSQAMLAGNARKLDEVVEDLLRPMLKQWLEGNLPQMVERLVREEIERVSRGRP